MIEFEIVEEFLPDEEIINTHPIELIIHEYKVKKISDKCFYISEHNQKYNLKEIK